MKKSFSALLLLQFVFFQVSIAQRGDELPPNQLVLPAGNYVVPLQWKGDSLHGVWEPHAALLVPVQLPGCPRTFYMQFDTGSPFSLLYGNKLTAIHQQYPGIKYLQTVRDTLINFAFKAGNMPVKANALVVKQFDSSGIDWTAKNKSVIIGTLGTDLIENKVVVIDYPRQQLFIGDSLPAVFRHQFRPADLLFMMRRILLPVTLLNKKTILYFDSGSSAFTLLTSQATCLQLATDTNTVIRYPVQSWNKTLTANTVNTGDSVTVAGYTIPLHQVTWIEGASAAQVNQMMKMGMGGMTGNKLFLQYALVLDTRNKKFGLVKR